MKKIMLFLITASLMSYGFSQQKTHIATRTFSTPKIDGKFNDSCWLNVPVAKDFLTNEPVFGKTPGQKTEVKLLYDDDAIYLAYYLYDTEPSKIIKVLTERDKNALLGDEMMLGIDTYGDKTTAFRFQVTAAGVQTERIMSPFIPRTDRSWDVVWESAVSINETGWCTEIKIPFSALRYPKKSVQEWIIQFGRYVGRTGEFTTWSPVNPNIGGGPVRQWGLLTGLKDIKPKIRLLLWPYLSLGVQRNPATDLIHGKNFSTKPFYSGGMDLKYGLNQSYTLDMSLVPDFSQIQSDNTILNLSPFEVKYDERRQFFTEGIDMFNKAGIFYSRRIGSVPTGYSTLSKNLLNNERIVENPVVTGIINATKLSGRTNKGFGIGVLNVITNNTYATINNDSTGLSRRILTEPLTNYNIFVVDQSLKHNSKIGIINTNVSRNGNATDANVTALDFLLNTKGNLHSLTGTAIYSSRIGSALPNGKQKGYMYKIDFSKVSKSFRYQFFHSIVNKNYNPNDLGILTQTNFMQNLIALKYYTFKPKGKVLNWNTSIAYTLTHTLDNMAFQKADIDWTTFLLFKDFSTMNFGMGLSPSLTFDIYEPRVTNRFFIRSKAIKTGLKFTTDTRKTNQLIFSVNYSWYEFPKHHFYYDAGISPIFRMGDRSVLTLSTLITKHNNNQGYVSTINADSINFGQRQELSVENIIQFQYFFSPYSNLNLRIRDYWSKVFYDQYFLLKQDGYLTPFNYPKNADFNLNIFNIDMIYTWQYAPGSFLSLSWKKNINFNNKDRKDGYFKTFANMLDTPGNNAVSLRLIYNLDYSNIMKFLKKNITHQTFNEIK